MNEIIKSIVGDVVSEQVLSPPLALFLYIVAGYIGCHVKSLMT